MVKKECGNCHFAKLGQGNKIGKAGLAKAMLSK